MCGVRLFHRSSALFPVLLNVLHTGDKVLLRLGVDLVDPFVRLPFQLLEVLFTEPRPIIPIVLSRWGRAIGRAIRPGPIMLLMRLPVMCLHPPVELLLVIIDLAGGLSTHCVS